MIRSEYHFLNGGIHPLGVCRFRNGYKNQTGHWLRLERDRAMGKVVITTIIRKGKAPESEMVWKLLDLVLRGDFRIMKSSRKEKVGSMDRRRVS
jgi:hypothetical protein